MTTRCSLCGNELSHVFRVVSDAGPERAFDSFECAIEALAPRCAHCACRIIGHAVQRGASTFCCELCARRAASDAVDEASRESFPASDPPAPPPSALAAVARGSARRREGRAGWILLWLLGIPIPILIVLYVPAGLHLNESRCEPAAPSSCS